MIADFKFYVNLKEIHKLTGDRNMCLEYGDATATKHGNINVCMYEPAKPGVSVTGEWRYLGTFHGNGEFTTADGRACTFKRGVDGLMVNEIQPEKKRCSCCGQYKPLRMFNSKGSGYQSYCRLCQLRTARDKKKGGQK